MVFEKIFFLVGIQKLYIHGVEFQVKITIKSKVIKEKTKYRNFVKNLKNWHIFCHNSRTTQLNLIKCIRINVYANCASYN